MRAARDQCEKDVVPLSSRAKPMATVRLQLSAGYPPGEIGANVLTHLLGQDVAEVGGKIRIYHDALRATGRDPADHRVTLMLHSYVADSREKAREVAREPMKDYLRSAAGLIKQFAWVFPAFKKPKGVDNPMQLDLGTLDELRVIAAAVIGGTALSGGIGTIYGAILGALIMQSLQSGMAMVGVDAPFQNIIVGTVLVVAVLVDIIYRKRTGAH